MRLRHCASVAGALALVMITPLTASAASGRFRYTYATPDGYEAVGFLNDPEAGSASVFPAPAPAASWPPGRLRAEEDSAATVFESADCEGDAFFAPRPYTGGGSDRLKVRSLVFS